jgi:hypothetical protein
MGFPFAKSLEFGTFAEPSLPEGCLFQECSAPNSFSQCKALAEFFYFFS